MTSNGTAESDESYLQDAAEKVYGLAKENTALAIRLRSTIEILEEAVRTYGVDNVNLSFNGGKDCTALLHIWAAVSYVLNGRSKPVLPALHVVHDTGFPEIEEFVHICVTRYGLTMFERKGTIKAALGEMMAKWPHIQAVVLGARRTDPFYANMPVKCLTDSDWPRVMRVHPLLDWTYSEIWEFLRSLNVPYCVLYDHGYTSLGNRDNTHPNPLLKNPRRSSGYDPAYLLADPDTERSGRAPSK